MSRTLLSQIRLRRHNAAVSSAVVMVMLAWLTLTLAGLCTRPMLQHQAETNATCPQDMETMNQHGLPTSPDESLFKVCLDAQADTSFAQAGFLKINKLTLWAVILPIVVALLFQRSSQPACTPQRRRRHPCSIPLFYQFCSLLN
jgi:hypothetical protein